jgi:hypothetical protein
LVFLIDFSSGSNLSSGQILYCVTFSRLGLLVDKDNPTNYQLVISYRLDDKDLTNQPTVDKTIALSTNCL